MSYLMTRGVISPSAIKPTKPASQDLSTAFFKSVQQASLTTEAKRMQETGQFVETKLGAREYKLLAPEPTKPRITVRPLPKYPFGAPLKEIVEAREAVKVTKTTQSHKASPERERVSRTSLAPEKVSTVTKIPETVTIAGQSIKTVYLIAGIVLVIVLALVLK